LQAVKFILKHHFISAYTMFFKHTPAALNIHSFLNPNQDLLQHQLVLHYALRTEQALLIFLLYNISLHIISFLTCLEFRFLIIWLWICICIYISQPLKMAHWREIYVELFLQNHSTYSFFGIMLNYVLISWCPYLFSCLSIANLWRTLNSGRTYSIVIQKHLNLIGWVKYTTF